jgi:uncharacterized membrane protein
MKKRLNVEAMIMTGLMTALIAVMTMAVAIPVPFTNGYIHPGDSMIFLSVLTLGWKRGAVAAGLGSAFADLFLGFVFWAPWTFVIKALMALITGLIIEKCAERRGNAIIACFIVAAMWLLFNAAVEGIILHGARDAAALANALGENDATGLGELVTAVQAQIMAAALLIPAALLIIAFALRKKEHVAVPPSLITGMTGGGLFMVFGYYIAGGLIYGNFAVAAFSVPANLLQFTGGFLITALLLAALQKTPAKRFLRYRFSQEQPRGGGTDVL